MKPRVLTINKHRSMEYYTPEDVEAMFAEARRLIADVLPAELRSAVDRILSATLPKHRA